MLKTTVRPAKLDHKNGSALQKHIRIDPTTRLEHEVPNKQNSAITLVKNFFLVSWTTFTMTSSCVTAPYIQWCTWAAFKINKRIDLSRWLKHGALINQDSAGMLMLLALPLKAELRSKDLFLCHKHSCIEVWFDHAVAFGHVLARSSALVFFILASRLLFRCPCRLSTFALAKVRLPENP